jgi:ketosteroid isomerase-like protein
MSEPGQFAVPRLIALYAERIDAGDFAGVADLFGDATVTAEGNDAVQRGADEVRAMYEGWVRRYDDGTPRTKHVTTNLILDVDEDAGTATCRSYFTVLQQTDALPLQPIIAGRYHDEFERADGTWRFTRRHMITDLVGDLGHHLTQPL